MAKQAPPEPRTGTNGPVRTGAGTIELHADWMYSDRDDCKCCPGRHAFARGADVTRSDWPSPWSSDTRNGDVVAHLHRAVASFGDDVDLLLIVTPKNAHAVRALAASLDALANDMEED